MEIKLITGGTTFEACKNTIEKIDVSDLDKQNLVVVPDAFSMQAESLIFDILKIKSTFNIEVVGISRLASKILKQNNISFQRLSALEEIFSIFKTVKENESKFKYFKTCDVDFCIKLLQIVKQFKACKIRPDQLKMVGDQNLDNKISDLKIIYEDYEKRLGDKLDLSKLLELFLEKSKNELNLSKINLFFVNFDSFSSEINSFICSLAKFVNKVFIGCAKPISLNNSFIYEDDILKKTISFAKKIDIDVDVEENATKLAGPQLTMAKNLFAFDVEGGKNDFFVNLICKNQREEIEFAAKIIKNKIINGKKFKDFAIAVSNKDYYQQIKTIFSQYEIYFYCDDAADLSQTLLGRFLIKVLELAKLGLTKNDFKYLCVNFLTECDDSENILSQIDYLNIEDADEFLQLCPQYKGLLNKIEGLKNCKILKDYILILLEILQMIEVGFNKSIEMLKESNQQKKFSENEQSYTLIIKTFEKLIDLGGEQKFDLLDFQSLLSLVLASVKVETIPSLLDAVFVGDATDSYFQDVDTLFVLGATSALPRVRSDNGIIDDADIDKLKINLVLEPEIKVINRRNRLKIFELLQHAKQKLIVSCPINENGKLASKANFVDDLIKMFGNNQLYADLAEVFDLGMSEDEKIEKLLFYISTKQNLINAYTALKGKEKLPKKYLSSFQNIIQDVVPKESDVKDYKKLSHKSDFSASELENYFICPFKHFLNYDLKILPKENVEPNRRTFGNFQHLLLHSFVENFNNLKPLTDKDIDNFLDKEFDQIAQKVYHEKILQRDYFCKYLKNESKIILKNVIKEKKNSNFEPFLLENKIFAPLDKNHNLIGFVDRVDKCGEYFRIIDYKTGKTEGLKKDLFYGKKLQLFLYADAIKKQKRLDCAGVYYFDCNTKYSKYNKNSSLLLGLTKKDNDVVVNSDYRLEEQGFRSDLIGLSKKKNFKPGEFEYKGFNVQEDFEKLFEYARNISILAIKEINEGEISKKPLKDACKNCPYISICRHNLEIDGCRLTESVKDEDF